MELVNRINVFFRLDVWTFWLSAVSCDCITELTNKSDHDLFCTLCAPTHALNHLLPPARNCVSLRTRGHLCQLPEYSVNLHKKSFYPLFT